MLKALEAETEKVQALPVTVIIKKKGAKLNITQVSTFDKLGVAPRSWRSSYIVPTTNGGIML